MSTPPSQHSGFTLIELLIVIAIIGILAALLFPAAQGALDSAKRTQAKNDVVQLATAVTAYETEYGRLPDTNSSPQDVKGAWLQALGGSNVSSLNPRQIVFIELATAKRGKSGLSNGDTFVDPFGGTYKIAFDGDYDNNVTAGTNSQVVRKKVAVWSTNSSSRKAVNSWE